MEGWSGLYITSLFTLLAYENTAQNAGAEPLGFAQAQDVEKKIAKQKTPHFLSLSMI